MFWFLYETVILVFVRVDKEEDSHTGLNDAELRNMTTLEVYNKLRYFMRKKIISL